MAGVGGSVSCPAVHAQKLPERKRYVSLFQQMSSKIASLQQEDGFWRASLLDPDSYPGGESSGTGFFTYALAWGSTKDCFLGAVFTCHPKGWKALVGAVRTVVNWVGFSLLETSRTIKKGRL